VAVETSAIAFVRFVFKLTVLETEVGTCVGQYLGQSHYVGLALNSFGLGRVDKNVGLRGVSMHVEQHFKPVFELQRELSFKSGL
jgi:hypothetical protein